MQPDPSQPVRPEVEQGEAQAVRDVLPGGKGYLDTVPDGKPAGRVAGRAYEGTRLRPNLRPLESRQKR